MRLLTVQTEKGPRACGLFEGRYVDLNAADPQLPSSVREILALGDEGKKRAEEATSKGRVQYTPESSTLHAPVCDPRKILCVGLNYRDHAAESGVEPPCEPVLFSKFATTLIGYGAPILLPSVSQEVDYEAELVIVIGKPGRDIARKDAFQHVAGYTIGHDVSARDWQMGKPGKQWLAGKTFDTFAPMGPALVTADEIEDPHDLRIQLRLNGKTMQDSNTSQFIFGVDEVVSYISQILTLEPGDLIFTGTPPGVGAARKPPVWLQPGDVVEVEIDGLGMLRNPVARR